MKRGFTIIEILIVTFIISAIVTGIFGLFALNIRTASEGQRHVIGLALANQRAEQIRNIPYAQVGVVGGVPSGNIPSFQTVVSNSMTFTVKTDIRYVDDVYDGTAGGTPNDTVNTDYKLVRVEVSWQAPLKANPIVLLMNVAPVGIEGGSSAGTLSFQALNANGSPVPDATVTLVNGNVSPSVNISTQTDDTGRVILPGLAASNRYQLVVSRPGYITEQTYTTSGSFIPDANHAQLTAIVGQLTSKTFSIDAASTVNVYTKDATAAALPGIGYTLKGTKTYATTSGQPTYVVNTTQTTDSAGTFTHTGLVWDSYTPTLSGVLYDMKESSTLLPLAVNPNTNQDITLTLVPHVPISLHVYVVSPTSQLIDNATVNAVLASPSYNQTLGTGPLGQVFFGTAPSTMSANGTYTLNVSAPGYQPSTQSVAASGTSTVTVVLNPTP